MATSNYLSNRLENMNISKPVCNSVHAVAPVLEHLPVGHGYSRLGFFAHVEGDTNLYRVHLYGKFTIFTMGQMLALANTAWKGKVVCCQGKSPDLCRLDLYLHFIIYNVFL